MTLMTHGNHNKSIESGWRSECAITRAIIDRIDSTPTAYRESYQGPSPLNPAVGQWEVRSSDCRLPIGQIRV